MIPFGSFYGIAKSSHFLDFFSRLGAYKKMNKKINEKTSGFFFFTLE